MIDDPVPYSLLPPPPTDPASIADAKYRSRPLRQQPSTAAVWLFHLGGVAITGLAGVVAFWAAVMVSFGTSTCSDDPAAWRDPAAVHDLQVGLAVVALSFAAVPATWAVLARACRFAWQPWLILGGCLAVVGLLLAFSVNQVSTWCF